MARTGSSATTGRVSQQQPFSVQCTSSADLTRVAQNLKAEAAGDRADRRRTQRQAGCRSGSAGGAFAWLCGSSHSRCPPQVAERPGAAAWTIEIGRVHREAARSRLVRALHNVLRLQVPRAAQARCA